MYSYKKKTEFEKYNIIENWNQKNDNDSNLEYCDNYNFNGWIICLDPFNPNNKIKYDEWNWKKFNFRIIPNSEYNLKIRLNNAEKDIIELKKLIKKLNNEINYINESGFHNNNL